MIISEVRYEENMNAMVSIGLPAPDVYGFL